MKINKAISVLVLVVVTILCSCENQMVMGILHNRIIMQTDGNGTAEASPDYTGRGGTVTISANPNRGFKFSEWQVVSGDVTLASSAESTVTFTMPPHSVTIKAFFSELMLDLSPVIFSDAEYGYAQPSPVNVTITNTGNIAIDVNSISLAGVNAASFILGGINTIDTVAAGSSVFFTVQPAANLDEGTYSASIVVIYDGVETTNIEFTFTVLRESLLAFSPVTISGVVFNYTQPSPVDVTISNNGNIAVYISDFTLSGADAGYFTLAGEADVTTLVAGESASFTVQPAAGLNAGNYTASIIAEYNNSCTIETVFSFFVDKQSGADVSGPATVYGIPSLGSITADDVIIPVNPGNQSVEYAVSVSNNTDPSVLTWQSTAIFTGLSSAADYYVYARSAENTNYYAGAASVSAALRLYSATANITFSDAIFGYEQPAAQTVTIENSGNTGIIITGIAISGSGAGSFILYEDGIIGNLASGDNSSFSVQPESGLNAGVYTATVTVTYDIYEKTETTVSFLVEKASGAAVNNAPVIFGLPALGSITVNNVQITANPGNQNTEYAISAFNNADPASLNWQSATTFTGLFTATDYFIYARSAENNNYFAGNPYPSQAIRFYAVTFDDNGAISGAAPSPIPALPGALITLPDWGTLKKNDSGFASWTCELGVDRIPGRSYQVTNNMTMSANWLNNQSYLFPTTLPAGGGTINSGIIISQTGNGYPLSGEMQVPGSSYSGQEWFYGTALLGNGFTLELDASDIRYNVPGFHNITLLVYSGAVPHTYTIRFEVKP
ncbi:MAG: choice-of-anchor D domain-containing protein [Treponema sp.]|nr:choice-of-anchor D domain-containing protein [Treponema sp.]